MDSKKQVRKIGSIVTQLMARRGYAQVFANEEMHRAITSVVDPALHDSIQVGKLRNGVLYVFVADSVSMHELNFQKSRILKTLQSAMPDSNVSDVRFRIQNK